MEKVSEKWEIVPTFFGFLKKMYYLCIGNTEVTKTLLSENKHKRL